MLIEELRNRIRSAGQEHVLSFYESLGQDGKERLLQSLADVDYEHLKSTFAAVTHPTTSSTTNIEQPQTLKWTDEKPPPTITAGTLTRLADTPETVRDVWKQTGLRRLAEGKVAAVAMAGGQGTRLGFTGPKGCFKVGPLSKMTLFEMMARKIVKLRQLVVEMKLAKDVESVRLPWYIMTADHNHEETVSFFQTNNYFGLDQRDVIFFEQSMVPCFDLEGKLLLDQKDALAKNPNGNGGIFRSMESGGVIDDMSKREVEDIHVFGIDNVLTRVADPVFAGFFAMMNVDAGNKCTAKNYPHEKVGVFCLQRKEGNTKPQACVVEYSEIPKDLAEKQEADGGLTFSAGNICQHFFKLDFVKRILKDRLMESSDTLHRADKKIPFTDPKTGERVTPSAINGIKTELFVFDSFRFANSVAGLECRREDEFAPVKNAEGDDSPASAALMMAQLGTRWLKAAGATVVPDPPRANQLLEVSPSRSYAGEGLQHLAGTTVRLPAYIS